MNSIRLESWQCRDQFGFLRGPTAAALFNFRRTILHHFEYWTSILANFMRFFSTLLPRHLVLLNRRHSSDFLFFLVERISHLCVKEIQSSKKRKRKRNWKKKMARICVVFWCYFFFWLEEAIVMRKKEHFKGHLTSYSKYQLAVCYPFRCLFECIFMVTRARAREHSFEYHRCFAGVITTVSL